MAAWGGGGQPFVLDYSAPYLPLIQGPQAFFAGLSQSRRNTKTQEEQAKFQQSQVDAANWGNVGRSLGFAGGMGLTALGNPSALLADNGALGKAFAVSTMMGSGAPIANWASQTSGAEIGRDNQFFRDYGVTQDQASEMGQRIYQNAPPEVRAQLETQFGGPGENPGVFHRQVGANAIRTQAVQQNAAQYAAQLQAQTNAQMEAQQMQQAQATAQGIDNGTMTWTNRDDAAKWDAMNKSVRAITSDTSMRPEDQQAAIQKIQQRRMNMVRFSPQSSFQQMKSAQQRVDEAAVIKNGHVLVPNKNGFMDLGIEQKEPPPLAPEIAAKTKILPGGSMLYTDDDNTKYLIEKEKDGWKTTPVKDHGGEMTMGEYSKIFTTVDTAMVTTNEEGGRVHADPKSVRDRVNEIIDGFEERKKKKVAQATDAEIVKSMGGAPSPFGVPPDSAPPEGGVAIDGNNPRPLRLPTTQPQGPLGGAPLPPAAAIRVPPQNRPIGFRAKNAKGEIGIWNGRGWDKQRPLRR